MREIASFDLVDDEDAVDDIYWNGSPNGGFSISSALTLIRNEVELNEVSLKKRRSIWRVSIPQKMRFFLWLAIQEHLMTNGNRFVRHLTEDPRCLVCGDWGCRRERGTCG